MDNRKKEITSAELAHLWSQYMSDSASLCVLTFFLEKVEDDEIRPIIEYSIQLSKTHLEKLTIFFEDAHYQVPYGFKVHEDVDLNAPKLYSDTFVLQFLHQMAKIGLTNYSAAVASSVRSDIMDYFTECFSESVKLFNNTTEVLLHKGLYVKTPVLDTMKKVEFVKKQGFVWDVFGEKRPLTVTEISNLYANIERNILGAATLFGFGQVSQDNSTNEFILRGIEIAKKHITLFSAKLAESNLPVPSTMDSEVSNSTAYTFSDKLIMFFTAGLISLSVGFYGTGVAQSPRIDLGVLFNRLSLEVQLFAEDGANIMIKKGWLEQPPMAPDRDELTSN